MQLKNFIRSVPNFPHQGIIFRDITPLLDNPEASNYTAKKLYELIEDKKIDKVVGIESRGFFFGTLIANKLNAGFVPVRKPNKLPHSKISQEFQLEYGTETLEIHIDAIHKGDRVLIHDDVLATGGTAEAVCKLVEQLGGEVVQCNFLMELSFLNGRERLSKFEVASLLEY